jgi:hypothetical protein
MGYYSFFFVGICAISWRAWHVGAHAQGHGAWRNRGWDGRNGVRAGYKGWEFQQHFVGFNGKKDYGWVMSFGDVGELARCAVCGAGQRRGRYLVNRCCCCASVSLH